VYSGYSMELYADGELDAFSQHSGSMGTTSNSLTFGRKDSGESNYFLRGVLDEVRIYNAIVPPDEITTLKDTWHEVVTGVERDIRKIEVYPNPATHAFFLHRAGPINTTSLQLYDVNGRQVPFEVSDSQTYPKITISDGTTGLVILRMKSGKNMIYRKIILK